MMSDMFTGGYTPDRSYPARFKRRLTQWRVAAPLPRSPKRPIITFTFDDFPKSAATNGAAIMEAAGARATYYAASGLSGRSMLIGDLFGPADLRRLEAAGHEIGSHTQSHQDCARTPLADSLADIELCDLDLMQMGLTRPADQFAYPFGEYSLAYKQIVERQGFMAAFGQQSGVAYAGADMFALPRFSMTTPYGDIERFRMTAMALPLPAFDVSPPDPYIKNNNPEIGFTIDEGLKNQVKAMSCFSRTRTATARLTAPPSRSPRGHRHTVSPSRTTSFTW
jgi:peptidoglycan/xylan/chitin deacetylase (PgdA/CDA1 family)